MTLIHNIWW